MRSLVLLLLALAMTVQCIEIEQAPESSFTMEQEEEMAQSGEKHEFQAEVGRLMDIIINSLYSQKEVFIRELISNAADALDKIRFEGLSDASALESSPKDLEVRVEYDNMEKTISFEDNGVGMTKEDLKENLGTVAKSGTTQFIEAIKGGNLNLIGQFGVGFYASFLAANKVQVWSKHNNDEQYIWESRAANEFTLVKDPRGNTLGRGTRVVLFLKEEAYDLLQENTLKGYIKKYSEYINFPIKLRTLKTTQKEVPVEEEPKEEEEKKEDDLEVKEEEDKEAQKPKTKTITEERWEDELQNTNKAIWTRSAEDVEENEYHAFYKQLSRSEEEPACYTHFKTDGGVEFKSILFAPKKAPAGLMENYYQAKSNAISLYVRRVLISDSFDDLMPKYLQFISGVVDSDDLPLNVNREQLQQSKMLKQISRKLVKKSIDMMIDLAKGEDDEEEEEEEDNKQEEAKDKKVNTKYLDFFKENGRFIKMGIMEDQANKHKLAKLLRFSTTYEYSSSAASMTSLEEYIGRMPENQKDIYFLGGENLADIYASPVIKKILKAGNEVLMLDETIDEFVFQHLDTFEEKKLVNVGKGSFTLPNENAEEEKKKLKKLGKHFKVLTDYWEKQFDFLQTVQVSNRLVEEPVVIVTSEYGTSATMEKLQKAQAYGMNKEQQAMQASFNKKVLEVNPAHPLIKSLLSQVAETKAADPEASLSADQTDLLHLLTQGAMIHAGYSLDNPRDFQARLFRQANVLAGVSHDAPLQEVDIDWEEEDNADEKDSSDTFKQEIDLGSQEISQDKEDL